MFFIFSTLWLLQFVKHAVVVDPVYLEFLRYLAVVVFIQVTNIDGMVGEYGKFSGLSGVIVVR